MVYEWLEMFENGRTSVTDAERSGLPATATTTRNEERNNEERTLELIRENTRSKRQSLQWKHPSSPVAKKFRTQPSAGKLMLTVVWDSQGSTLETYQERGATVTSAMYCDILQRELKPAICSKRRGKLSKEILLSHDNAHPHTLETLKQQKWEAMEHPAYSPDLAPSDFHLFRPLKNALQGRRFSRGDVKAAVHQWLRTQQKPFFADGIKKMVGHWEKCIAKQGDIIEKWCNLFLKFLINRVKKKRRSAETFWRALTPWHYSTILHTRKLHTLWILKSPLITTTQWAYNSSWGCTYIFTIISYMYMLGARAHTDRA